MGWGCKYLRHCSQLLVAVTHQFTQDLSLALRQRVQLGNAALGGKVRQVQHHGFQGRTTNAELVAAFGRVLQLALKGRLVDLPGNEARHDPCIGSDPEMEEVRAADRIAGRLIKAGRVEPGATGQKQQVAGLKPVWCSTTSDVGS